MVAAPIGKAGLELTTALQPQRAAGQRGAVAQGRAPTRAHGRIPLIIDQEWGANSRTAAVERGLQFQPVCEAVLVRETQQAGARGIKSALGHRAGLCGHAGPGRGIWSCLPWVGRELRPGEAARQLVADVGVEQVGRQRGFGAGRGAGVKCKNIALHCALLAVAIELLVGVLGAHATGGTARFGRDGAAAQPEAAHRGPHGHRAATRRHLRRTEQGHAARARPIHAAGRPLQHLQPPDDGGVEQVQGRAATSLRKGNAVVVHFHVAHPKRRAQRAAPNAEAVASRGPLLQPHAGQRIHGLGEGSGTELRNHAGINHAHGGGGAAQRQPLAVARDGGFVQGHGTNGIEGRLGGGR